MRIRIEVLGLPELSAALAKGETILELPGTSATARDVLGRLIEKFGPPARKALYDQRGALNSLIQIALNGEKFISPNRLDTPLHEGDTLTFMLLMAGGEDVRSLIPD
ncbi:MAG: MoaD/ThiS family protein [Deltaproteobacteria bacterium]|nr:MoaD/ThiS family protein [Deltaproteobacteria bacterium]MBW2121256.1 MoaD/ThiS family protein [Deltaproteobacteria bacterium]